MKRHGRDRLIDYLRDTTEDHTNPTIVRCDHLGSGYSDLLRALSLMHRKVGEMHRETLEIRESALAANGALGELARRVREEIRDDLDRAA